MTTGHASKMRAKSGAGRQALTGLLCCLLLLGTIGEAANLIASPSTNESWPEESEMSDLEMLPTSMTGVRRASRRKGVAPLATWTAESARTLLIPKPTDRAAHACEHNHCNGVRTPLRC